MYAIEKNIPPPRDAKGGFKGPFRLTLEALDVGDSFVCDKYRSSAQQEASRIGKELKRRFRTAKIDNNTCRIWRVA